MYCNHYVSSVNFRQIEIYVAWKKHPQKVMHKESQENFG